MDDASGIEHLEAVVGSELAQSVSANNHIANGLCGEGLTTVK